jgi:hypothetical protein
MFSNPAPMSCKFSGLSRTKRLCLSLGYIVSPRPAINKRKNAGLEKMILKEKIRSLSSGPLEKKQYITNMPYNWTSDLKGELIRG